MSEPVIGRYHFLSWARRGIGASIKGKDGGGALPSRAVLDVQLALTVDNAPAPTQPPPNNVQLFGPGDVIGIDPRHIIRTEPRNLTVNFEPNYLCGIEFDTPDMPWLFTPAEPNGDKLRPWLALIALKADEFNLPSVAPNPLACVDVLKISALQSLDDSWNWAHTQVSGDASLTDSMASAPGNVISRLLCPRRLDPETHYTVFLVPAFEIGRQVGLGQDVSAVTTTNVAWTSATAVPLRLPFYYTFEFNTSDQGDFESLVRALTPTVLPAGVGQRLMDVSQPAADFPSAGTPLELEGALHSVLTVPTPWSDPDKTNFQTKLQEFINQPLAVTLDVNNPGPDPVITAPIYGRWHAAVQSVDRTAAGWVNDLNLDPRNRSAAGMGTQVVQKERTQLMASAWQQVDGVRKANEVLHQAQLARSVLQQIYRHQLVIAQPETVLTLTAPLHAKLLASPITILAKIRASRLPERMVSGTFRRATRPRRRLGTSPVKRTSLITRVNSGEVPVVPPAKPPGGLVSIEQVSSTATPPEQQWLAKNWRWVLILFIVLAAIAVIVAAAAAGVAAAVVAIVAVVAAGVALWKKIQDALHQKQEAADLTMAGFTPQAASQAAPNAAFAVVAPGVSPGASSATGADSVQATAFRSAAEDLFTAFQDFPAEPAPAPALDFAELKTTLMTRLDPVTTVARRMQYFINYSSRLSWQAPDLLEPIMAAPDFPQPMYAPLRDLSAEYVLPGVELIKPDTVGLLLANHGFIEGYMVGLNYEMARQLLWNDYPTDQRGSYFRQFWDVSAYVPQAGDPTDPVKLTELLKDIPLIHTWPKPVPLGDHPNRTDVPLNNVVLLVRGELFKRYPNAVVYAGKATMGPKGTRILDETDERYPIFRGVLPTDITFLGFNLDLDDARGGTASSPEGFFFIFQQQPSEPRFGLEPKEDPLATPVTHWADLAWTNFGAAKGGGGGVYTLPDPGRTTRGLTIAKSPWRLASQVFSLVLAGNAIPDFLTANLSTVRVAIPADGGNPADPDYSPDDAKNNWGVNSAQSAHILLREPFRILIHADLMLPTS
jgi:hypothetical protein